MITLQLPLPGVIQPDCSEPAVQCDRKSYLAEIEQRWYGPALTDARRNWSLWQEQRPILEELVASYLANPFQRDLHDKCHNPPGSLTGMLWEFVNTYPWLMDFEEHHQTCFLRRGVVQYCKLLIQERKYRAVTRDQAEEVMYGI